VSKATYQFSNSQKLFNQRKTNNHTEGAKWLFIEVSAIFDHDSSAHTIRQPFWSWIYFTTGFYRL